MHNLNVNSQIKQSESIYSSQIDNEAVMLNVNIGKYFGMNPIATDIWAKIKTPMTVGTLVTELTNEYSISEEACQKDVLGFLNTLADNGLIDVLQHELA